MAEAITIFLQVAMRGSLDRGWIFLLRYFRSRKIHFWSFAKKVFFSGNFLLLFHQPGLPLLWLRMGTYFAVKYLDRRGMWPGKARLARCFWGNSLLELEDNVWMSVCAKEDLSVNIPMERRKKQKENKILGFKIIYFFAKNTPDKGRYGC